MDKSSKTNHNSIYFTIYLLTITSILTNPNTYAQDDLFEYGGDLRLGAFYSDNFDLDNRFSDEEDMYRIEAHLWLQANMEDNITARLGFELDRERENYNPADPSNLQTTDFEALDFYIDEAYLEFARIAASGLTVKLGRQYMNYGDDPNSIYSYNTWWGPGFIIGDSLSNSPLLLTQLGDYEIDPFDAFVARYDQEFYSIDALYSRTPEDSFLGVDGSDLEASMGALYYSYYGIENKQLDAYFTFSDQNGPSNSIGFDGDRFILGGRFAGDLLDELAFKIELAYQFENRNRIGTPEADALGAQIGVNYHPSLNWKPNFGFMYTYLGQNGATGRMTGFAAPFEGKTYGLAAEGLVKRFDGFNPFTNMHVYNLRAGLKPIDNFSWNTNLFILQLDKETVLSNDNTGVEIDSKVDYQWNPWMSSYLGGGIFIPGDATEDLLGNDDNAIFMQAGMNFKF